MSQISDTEVARWALDASDWLWGTVQGAFNEKQSTSQIVVDAVVGMIPLVGDATAARDLIAVSTRMANDPKKREEVTEWMLLVVLVCALVPILGGILKGVGRLVIKAIKEAAENRAALKEVVEFLNRMGHGNAVKWAKALSFAKYQSQIERSFNALMDKFIEVFTAFKDKLGWFTPASMKTAIDGWITKFKALKAAGAKMIPKAIKELDTKLKEIQKAVYEGEWHTVMPGTKTVVREAEARVVENAPRKLPAIRNGHKANTIADYHHVEGWPDLRVYSEEVEGGAVKYPNIEAFSGAIKAIEIKPGTKIIRILKPKALDPKKGNMMASPWWASKMPETAEEWRELYAVLDKFNKNGHFIVYTVPEGTTLKAWTGKAAEQFDDEIGQYLGGGGLQLFIDFPVHVKQAIEQLPVQMTGWGETTKLYGFGKGADAAIQEIQVERLAANERQAKGLGNR
jgi:hypothetical protein